MHMKILKNYASLLIIALYVCSCNKDTETLVPIINFNEENEDYFKNGIDFTSEYDGIDFTFTTNVDWNITLQGEVDDETWCTVTPNKGSAGNNRVSIRVNRNDGFDNRNITLTLQAGNIINATTITQKQKNVLVVPITKYELPSDGGKIDVKIETNTKYEVEIPELYKNWITQISVKSVESSNIIFEIRNNPNVANREGFIIVKNEDLSEIITINQESALAVFNIEKAGTLATFIGDNISQITRLKLSGLINGDDVIILKRMDNLIYLDLKDCSIVEGGNSYASGMWATEPARYYTSNNSIGPRMFCTPYKLKKIILPDNVIEIGLSAFEGNSSIEEISIPNSVLTISKDAFMFCRKLKTITLPNNLSKVESHLFYECSSLTEILIPNSVITVEGYSFSGCSLLAKITLPKSLKTIGYGAFQKTAIEEIVIPENVSVIGGYAFTECNKLTTLTIPVSVKDIGNECFLRSLKINKVFLYATPTVLTLIGSRLFSDIVYENAILYVPFGKRDSFLYTEFGNFKYITELENPK